MKEIRQSLEQELMNWQNIATKKMFGCPCYKVNEKLFVFLITNAVVITDLNQEDKTKLSKQYPTTFFRANNREMKNWIQIPINNKEDLKPLLPYIRKAYELVKSQ